MNDKVKEAQEAWESKAIRYAAECYNETDRKGKQNAVEDYCVGVDDFKQALKRDLEKELTSCPSKIGVHYNNGILEALRKIDTCKP